jgi:hypothetical protein
VPRAEAEELGTFETNRHPFGVVLVVVRGEGLLLGECLDLHQQCCGPGLGPRTSMPSARVCRTSAAVAASTREHQQRGYRGVHHAVLLAPVSLALWLWGNIFAGGIT